MINYRKKKPYVYMLLIFLSELIIKLNNLLYIEQGFLNWGSGTPIGLQGNSSGSVEKCN